MTYVISPATGRSECKSGSVRSIGYQGVLERANIKFASVIADIMGVSGRAMLEALIAGRADPAAMAALAQRRMRSKIPLIEQALTGVVHNHHRQLLAMQ